MLAERVRALRALDDIFLQAVTHEEDSHAWAELASLLS